MEWAEEKEAGEEVKTESRLNLPWNVLWENRDVTEIEKA